MSNNKPLVNFLLLLIAIYLSSISQLFLFDLFPNLISIKKSSEFVTIGNLWIGGIALDIMSLVMFTLPSLFLKKYMSPLHTFTTVWISMHIFELSITTNTVTKPNQSI
jgi:hypothetical protein